MNKFRLSLTMLLCLCLAAGAAWASNPKARAETNTGINNVAKGTVVKLLGMAWTDSGSVVSYNWALTARPSGSTAALDSASQLNSSFRPDLIGSYTVTYNATDDHGATSPTWTMNLNVSTWLGAGYEGGPNNCACHPDKFSTWSSTKHATKLEREIDGGTDPATSHYSGSCIRCHTVGYNTDSLAVNNGFDDVMHTEGWTFPAAPLAPGNWDALVSGHPNLAVLANIQCENCHGPANNHHGDPTKMDASMSEAVCAQCHEAPPGHPNVTEWRNSNHSKSIISGVNQDGRNRKQCGHCHTAEGFMEVVVAGADSANGAPYAYPHTVTCQVCHANHDAFGDNQLRTTSYEMVCDNCHRLRLSTSGPHESHQSNMFDGNSGYQYPGHTYRNNAMSSMITGRCITCHMAAGPNTKADSLNPAQFEIGNHTWRLRYDNGTPDDESDDSVLVTGCVSCHPGTTTLNIDGEQDDITALLDTLAWLFDPAAGTSIPRLSAIDTTTPAGLSKYHAAYNYKFVANDGSRGVHNPTYAHALLRDAIADYRPYTGIASEGPLPAGFFLLLDGRNPITTEANLRYGLPRAAMAKVEILASDGSVVATLVDGSVSAGSHSIIWTPSTPGIYMARLTSGGFTNIRKMVVVR